MILSPDQYAQASTWELIAEAARGHVPIDHRWLRAILDRGEDAADEFVRIFREPPEDACVAVHHALLDLARQWRTARAVPFLAEYVRELNYEFSDELIEAYISLGAEALEPLLELAKETPDNLFDVTFTLASLGVRDPRILDLLASEIDKFPIEVSISIARYGDPAARPALERALASAADETAKFALTQALEELGEREPEEPEPFDIFEHYPEEDIPDFGAFDTGELLEFLSSPMPEYRALAASALGLDQLSDDARGRLFELAQSDPDAAVRGAAWEALEGAAEDPNVAAVMRNRLFDGTAPIEERVGALVALAQTAGDDESVRSCIVEFLELPGGRAAALEAMWHSTDRRFAEYPPRYVDDPDPDVRRQAIAAIGWLGITAHLGAVEEHMDDEDVREAALFAYVLAAPGETSPARMRKLFRRVEELAGGLSDDEGMIVRKALDDRLQLNGHEPMFVEEAEEAWEKEDDPEPEPQKPAVSTKVGRNDPCPCGSGKKYKKCCGAPV